MESVLQRLVFIVQFAKAQSFERVASLVLLALLCTTLAGLP